MNDVKNGNGDGGGSHGNGNGSDGDGRQADGEHIDINKANDLRRWSRELRVDERTLKAAVLKAGPSVSAVRKFLRTSRPEG
jgi:hypothetical protein